MIHDCLCGIAAHQNRLLCGGTCDAAVADDLGGGCGHGLEGLDGLFRLAFLVQAQHRVYHHHEQDDEHVREGFMGIDSGGGGDGGGHDQDDDHRIRQLFEQPLEQGVFFPFLETVGAAFLQALCRLGGVEPLVRAADLGQDLFRGLSVNLHVRYVPSIKLSTWP